MGQQNRLKLKAISRLNPSFTTGDHIDIPLFPRINREQTFYGSNWGNCTDLSEVMALAAGKIQHKIAQVRFDRVNETIERLREGSVIGRAVMTF